MARLDIFDAGIMTPSIGRGRELEDAGMGAATTHRSERCSPRSLAVSDATVDVAVVAFTAHEIRDASVREEFFKELHRILRGGGRVILVEHLRDAANLLFLVLASFTFFHDVSGFGWPTRRDSLSLGSCV